jgi:hypothetical protein
MDSQQLAIRTTFNSIAVSRVKSSILRVERAVWCSAPTSWYLKGYELRNGCKAQ